MKKTNRFLTYATCILMAIIVACGSLMFGSSNVTAADTLASESTTADLSYKPDPIPTEGDITDAILDFVSTNELQDEFSEAGQEILKFSWNAEIFLNELIKNIRETVERVSEFLRHLFRVAKF